VSPTDDRGVSARSPVAGPDPGLRLLELYDEALPHVYGYLLSRCGEPALAEDLTAETFLAAVAAARKPDAPPLGIGWLVGVARHKLVDHWRAVRRERRGLREVSTGVPERVDPWDEEIDALRARQTLAALGAQHRAALTLRYLDGLPVAEVAGHLGRTVHATEALLVRARNAFRRAYTGEEGTP
jgi:RNA polymerase sigma-70 factor (ECF subfamily)